MVSQPRSASRRKSKAPYWLKIAVGVADSRTRSAILAALAPEVAAIDSKRVAFDIKPSRKQIAFHLAAHDAAALRAAATSLMRLYSVAEGVVQETVSKNE
jgi:tRNA threonylcarbamoyladenosine modification (KEOPS) complex  Pcc1 subunit